MQRITKRCICETGILSWDPGALSRTGGSFFSPNGMAEVMKILLTQMTGVEWPWPGSFFFHIIFFSSDHSIGGLHFSGAVPLPVAPRQEGQFVWAVLVRHSSECNWPESHKRNTSLHKECILVCFYFYTVPWY